MVKVQYTGSADSREITKAQFSAVPEENGGPLDHDKVVWDSSNDHIAEVSAAVAKWLEENYGGDFKRVDSK